MSAGEPQIWFVGNLVDDPELRYTPTGQPVAKFRVACTPRFKDQVTGEWKDGDTTFMTCSAWRQMAENVAESLVKGARVIVVGSLRQRSYETREGEKRTVYEVQADSVGPDLKNASAKVTRANRQGAATGPGNGTGNGGPASRTAPDPWADTSTGAAPATTAASPTSQPAADPWASDQPPF